MISLGNRISTTTRDYLLPVLVDTVLDSNVFATRQLKKAKKWTGATIQMPVKTSKNSTSTSWSGFDVLPTSATDNRQKLQFSPGFVSISSVLPFDELMTSMNSGSEEQVFNLISLTMESDTQDLADTVGTQFYADGQGNGGKDLQGLGIIVDDGTAVATYGGLSRTTYPTLDATLTASGGTLTLAKMQTLGNNITSGTVRPTAGVCSEAVFSLYEQLLDPQMRYEMSDERIKNGSAMGSGAKSELFFRGFPVLRDEKATASTMFFLNENFIYWYGIDSKRELGLEPISYSSEQIEGNDYSKAGLKNMGFLWSGWVRPANQMAFIGYPTLAGQLVCNDPKRNGKLTGVTSV